ncbi:MAG: amidohydrolase family protein, partial [Desulfatiglandales bacterium]
MHSRIPRGSPGSDPPDEVPDIIIEAGILLTMARDNAPIENARVVIRGDRIVDILSSVDQSAYPEGVEVIHAEKGIVMPGLINAHAHTAMTLFRGLADDLPLKQWLFDKIFPAEARTLSPETVYWGTLLGCLEMIASGTTTVVDGYFFEDDAARAVQRSCMRALVGQGVIDFPAPGVADPRDNLKVGEQFLERWAGISDLITPGLFCHSPVTCSDTTLKRARDISKAYGLPLQIHLSETREEVDRILQKTGERPVLYLEHLGVLGRNLVAAHGIHLDDTEIDILAQRQVKIVHVPESNMKLSSGVARVPEMAAKGVTVALGTDGCASNNNLDMFQEMDSTAKIHKVVSMDPVTM